MCFVYITLWDDFEVYHVLVLYYFFEYCRVSYLGVLLQQFECLLNRGVDVYLE